ncbi:MAG: prolyl oligopeptidase family serine peptidase [Treponema sp.]|nr:prolyl oligopeptidase family serine peptidase [Treponema sp.]
MKNLKPRRQTRRELVTDDYHGTIVADPYRWLENDSEPEVQKWMDEQQRDFEDYIGALPVREKLKARLESLWRYERRSVPAYVGAPTSVGGMYYAWRNDGLQNQSALYRMENPADQGELVLDPNALSADGTVAVMSAAFSPKGNFLAYGLSTSGSDWQEIKVLNLKTLANTSDIILHTKLTSATWLPDESGFIYTRYPEQDESAILDKKMTNAMVYVHKLGEAQSADRLLHKDDAHPQWLFGIDADEDNKWLFLSTSYSTLARNMLHYKPFANLDSPWLALSDNFDDCFRAIGAIGDTAYVYTEKDAPFGKVMSAKLSASGLIGWETIVEDKGEKLEDVYIANNHIICVYLRDATSCVKIFDKNGNHTQDVELPGLGSISAFSCRQNREEFFIQFDGYLYPAAIFRLDFSGGKPAKIFAPKIDFHFDDYETVREFYVSRDGARVPIFITARKGLKLDRSNPTLLYGYGGFNINMTPAFSARALAWLESGGVYAVPCLRGGAEYGEAWHRAGMLESKQNTFDDFIAAGEYLISSGRTKNEKLAILGGSNGGLLTAACLTQRPELFGAVVVAVPVIDMLRYHLFTLGRLWTGEYGCAEDRAQFPFMYKYSPLHNVKMNVAHPATLIITADTDDRVVPGHARKFAATLQAADGGESPILIRIEKSAGHGHGKPVSKVIEESADMLAFLLSVLEAGGRAAF